MIGQVRLPNGTILVMGDDLKWTVRGDKDDWLAGPLNAYQSPRQCDQGPACGSPGVQALVRVAGIFGVRAEVDDQPLLPISGMGEPLPSRCFTVAGTCSPAR
jgi:hypothetical protein